MLVQGPGVESWLCEQIGYVPSLNFKAIGREKEGRLCAAVGYDGINGASCQIHVAGVGRWMNREILFAAFDYPFNQLGLKVLIGLVPSGNVEALKLNRHLGFRAVAEIQDAHPDGSLILLQIRREECRWIR